MDLSYQEITIECPECQFHFEIFLKQVTAEERVICPGCLAEIQLQDEGGSLSHTEREIEESLRKLLRGLGG